MDTIELNKAHKSWMCVKCNLIPNEMKNGGKNVVKSYWTIVARCLFLMRFHTQYSFQSNDREQKRSIVTRYTSFHSMELQRWSSMLMMRVPNPMIWHILKYIRDIKTPILVPKKTTSKSIINDIHLNQWISILKGYHS